MDRRVLPQEIAELVATVAKRIPANASWAITCGSALALNGVDHRPTDLDIFAPGVEAQRIWRSLQGLPEVFPYHFHQENGITSNWGRYKIDGVELDVVGDFTVRTLNHTFSWNTIHPCWTHLNRQKFNNIEIPYFRLEDLLMLYIALPGEGKKIAGVVAKLRAARLDREYLSLVTGGNAALESYVAELMRSTDDGRNFDALSKPIQA